MAISNEQKQQAANWLQQNTRPICPTCGHNNFAIDDIVVLPTVTGDAINMVGPLRPMVVVVCGKCFNARLFSAEHMGVKV